MILNCKKCNLCFAKSIKQQVLGYLLFYLSKQKFLKMIDGFTLTRVICIQQE